MHPEYWDKEFTGQVEVLFIKKKNERNIKSLMWWRAPSDFHRCTWVIHKAEKVTVDWVSLFVSCVEVPNRV